MKITMVVFDGVQALDVAGPLDVFAEANTFLTADQQYEMTVVGLHAGMVTCSNGMALHVPNDYSSHPEKCDLLLVAGGPQLPGSKPDHAFLAWLQEQAAQAGRFGSVCNGAFLLGHAGLLDGRDATTHWSDAKLLAEQFPLTRVVPDKIFIRDGRMFTSAGVTAGIDLCLSLVAEDWGHELAVRVAKRLVVYIRRDGGQSQYSPYQAADLEEVSIVGKVLKFVTEHISETLSVEQIADAVGVGRRTFSRVFAKDAQVTPSVFIEQVRIDFARKLLEETDVPMKTIAYRCGFHSATHMRMIFTRRLGVTPMQYQQRFHATEHAEHA
ncbi:GlxA family transcriptional regulator [Aquirhabdus parva]|uniref:GlxA family transcriptional regulator n=2 Tax=Aquirhabdus parva TaxID=2283318 RepID=A0A345P9E7_9GAMM|nr:GlxA family transcriptional regulator [Aquirhabdus parva]